MFTHITLTTYSVLDHLQWHLHVADQPEHGEGTARAVSGGTIPCYEGEGAQLTPAEVLRAVADALDRT